MLIKKGGIYRDIKDTRFAEFKQRGYEVADLKADITQIPIDDQTFVQLKEYAVIKGIDLKGARSYKDILAVIKSEETNETPNNKQTAEADETPQDTAE